MILLTFNLCGPAMAQTKQSVEDLQRAQITKEKSLGLRFNPRFELHTGFGYIGDLVSSSNYWKTALLLSDSQQVTIKRLDALLYQAKVVSMSYDADYLDTNPRDFKEYLERNAGRRKAAVKHGQRMSLTGLLTPFQLNAMIQHYASTRNALSFHDGLIQGALGFSEAQKKRIIQAQSEYNQHTQPLFLGSMRADANQADLRAAINHFQKKYQSDLQVVLTPVQKQKWEQLSTKPPLPEAAPEMPLPSDEDQKRINVKERSDVFRAIVHLQNENELNLSEAQTKHLDELYVVTQRGLFWIEVAKGAQEEDIKNDISGLVRTEAEFLKHAEQIALLGILTEIQARQVQEVL
tara:strand:+ start:86647 stop:87693 length:1047 start_codon:yes stop_codon:yes gene_type:complete